jgi:hypothetical protein
MILAAMNGFHSFPLIKELPKLLDASDWEYSVLGILGGQCAYSIIFGVTTVSR